jgi:hypothetical protein
VAHHVPVDAVVDQSSPAQMPSSYADLSPSFTNVLRPVADVLAPVQRPNAVFVVAVVAFGAAPQVVDKYLSSFQKNT